jgi:hypothetical protein
VGTAAIVAPPAAGPVAFGTFPYPSNLHLDETGHVALPGLPGAAGGAAAELNTLAALRNQTGFGLSTALFFPFEGPLDPASLEQSVALVDLDASPPTLLPFRTATRERDGHLVVVAPPIGQPLYPGRRYGAFVSINARGSDGLPVRAPELLRAALGLPAMAGAALPDPGSVARVAGLLQPLVAVLPALGLGVDQLASATVFTTGDPAAELFEIRAQLEEDAAPEASVLPRNLPGGGQGTAAIYTRAELDDYFGVPAEELPGGDNASADGQGRALAHGALGFVIHGYFDSPWFLSADPSVGGIIQRDTSGRFAVKAVVEIPFVLALPDCPGASGCSYQSLRIAVFTHGLGSSRRAALSVANGLAQRGIATIGIDLPFHGSRFPGAVDLMNAFNGQATPDQIGDDAGLDPVFAFSLLGDAPAEVQFSPRAMADSFRQSAIDLMQLARLVTSPRGFSRFQLLDPALANLRFDTAGGKLVYTGESFGSINGVAPFVVEPSFGAAALSVGGGGFLTYTVGYSAEYEPMFYAIIRVILGAGFDDMDGGSEQAGLHPEFHPALNIFQQAFEPGDPLTYARLAAVTPPAGQAPKHTLLIVARNDESVPNIANEALGEALGLTFVGADPQTFPRFTPLPAAVLDAGGSYSPAGGPTLAMVEFRPATHVLLTAQHGTARFPLDAEFPPFTGELDPRTPIDNPIVRVQALYGEFIESFYRTGTPAIRVPAAGN